MRPYVPKQPILQPFNFVVRPGARCQARETATQLQNKERSLTKRHIRPRRAKTLVFVTDMKTAEGRMHKAQEADPMKSACCRRLGTTPTLLQWDCLSVCVSLCGQVHMCREEVARVCVEAT